MKKAILLTSLLILPLACKSEKNSRTVNTDTSEFIKTEQNMQIENQSDELEITIDKVPNQNVHDIPIEFTDKKWYSYFGSLSPKENISLSDLQLCSWQRNDTILIFSGEGHYAALSRGGNFYGGYILENNTVHFSPPFNIIRFTEKNTISSLYYSNEMYYTGTPVLINNDETIVFSANNSKKADVGEMVKLYQYYCEKIWEIGRVNKNGILYSLPDILSMNMFKDDHYGENAISAIVVRLAKTKIDNIVWYYTLFDFTIGDPIDGGGPFYEGWLPQEYFE